MSFKFNCGDVVQDRITSYQGTIIARTEQDLDLLANQIDADKIKAPSSNPGGGGRADPVRPTR